MMSRTAALAAATALLLTGCGLARRPLAPVRRYALDPPAVRRAGEPKPAPLTLAVRAFSAASRYRECIFFRAADSAVGQHENDRWVEPPAEMLTRAFERALRSAAVAREVVDDRMVRRADAILEGRVTRFDEVHDKQGWRAEAEVELVLRPGDGDRILLAAPVFATRPVPEKTTPAFVRAMNAAVGELLAAATVETAKALATLKPPAAPPPLPKSLP